MTGPEVADRSHTTRLEEYIRHVIAAAPPLSEDQRDALAALLKCEVSE